MSLILVSNILISSSACVQHDIIYNANVISSISSSWTERPEIKGLKGTHFAFLAGVAINSVAQLMRQAENSNKGELHKTYLAYRARRACMQIMHACRLCKNSYCVVTWLYSAAWRDVSMHKSAY